MTPALRVALRVAPSRGAGQDRVLHLELDGLTLLAVADGAGGTAGGAAAAELCLERLSAAAKAGLAVEDPAALIEVIRGIDQELSVVGQTTVVVIALHAGYLTGASVGDSVAWLVGPGAEFADLTANQQRKPLLGSVEAWPVAFQSRLDEQTLLLATDGLAKYAPTHRLCELARTLPLEDLGDRLVDAVRLKSGGLQDDVGIVAARRLATHA